MRGRSAFLLLGLAVLTVALAGCGSDNGGETSTQAATGPSPAVKSQFLNCLKQANIQVVSSGNASATKGAGAKGRVPIHTLVPAEYLGAAVLPHRGYFDLWLASDPANGKKAAKKLNDALSEQVGSTVEAASARGVVVNAAPANVGIVSFSDADAIDRCTDKL